jgi:predicted ArsR family transcriptional regulator
MAESEDKKGKVEKYLKEHSGATEDQIAKDTHLHVIDVLSVLYDMEAKGEVTSAPA